MTRCVKLAAVLLALAAGCSRVDEAEAKAAVKAYLDKLVEAYAAGDEAIVDPLVSEAHGRKLLGTIGVKSDMGLVLESKLLAQAWEKVTRDGDAVLVDTREQWAYRDVRVATGQQEGEASTDAYAIRYRLVRKGGKLIVDDVAFREAPVVGRKAAPMAIDVRTAHGLGAEEAPVLEGTEGRPPPARPDPAQPSGPPPGQPPTPGGPPPGHPPIPPGAAGGK